MTKSPKFSFLPSFYCSLSIWCSRDQLKSPVTVETPPHGTPPPAPCSLKAPGWACSAPVHPTPACRGAQGAHAGNRGSQNSPRLLWTATGPVHPSQGSLEPARQGSSEQKRGACGGSLAALTPTERVKGGTQAGRPEGRSTGLGGGFPCSSLAPPPALPAGLSGCPGTKQARLAPAPAPSHCFSSQHPQVQVHLGVTSCLVAPGNQTGQT